MEGERDLGDGGGGLVGGGNRWVGKVGIYIGRGESGLREKLLNQREGRRRNKIYHFFYSFLRFFSIDDAFSLLL